MESAVRPATALAGFIDVHHHVTPPAWVAGALDAIAATTRRTAEMDGGYPLLATANTVEGLARLGLSTEDMTAIAHGNTLRLFPRLS